MNQTARTNRTNAIALCPECGKPCLDGENLMRYPRMNAGDNSAVAHFDCLMNYGRKLTRTNRTNGALLKDITYSCEVVFKNADTAVRANLANHKTMRPEHTNPYKAVFPSCDMFKAISQAFGKGGFFYACERKGYRFSIAEVVLTMERPNGQKTIAHVHADNALAFGDELRKEEFLFCLEAGFPKWSALYTGTRK